MFYIKDNPRLVNSNLNLVILKAIHKCLYYEYSIGGYIIAIPILDIL